MKASQLRCELWFEVAIERQLKLSIQFNLNGYIDHIEAAILSCTQLLIKILFEEKKRIHQNAIGLAHSKLWCTNYKRANSILWLARRFVSFYLLELTFDDWLRKINVNYFFLLGSWVVLFSHPADFTPGKLFVCFKPEQTLSIWMFSFFSLYNGIGTDRCA